MANSSLNDCTCSLNPSVEKSSLTLCLEQAQALAEVALSDEFTENSKLTIYAYMTVMSDVIDKAKRLAFCEDVQS